MTLATNLHKPALDDVVTKIPKDAVKIAIREILPEDVSFLYSSWLKSYRNGTATRLITNNVYFAAHHKVIENILSRLTTRVLVACAKDDPDQIFGYGVFEALPGAENTAIIHYVYVKQPYRSFGVAAELVRSYGIGADTVVFYTHATAIGNGLGMKQSWVYNPYMAYR